MKEVILSYSWEYTKPDLWCYLSSIEGDEVARG